MLVALAQELKQIDELLRNQSNTHSRDNYKQDWVFHALMAAKARAKKLGLEFNITEKDVILPDYCPILGLKLEVANKHRTDSSPSLDRVDNTKGYIKGNIHIISWRANKIKSNATLEELMKIAEYFVQFRNQIGNQNGN